MTMKKATIVDVRTPEEFHGGHVEGSINIPMHQVQQRLEEIKKLPQPLILCCASGNRSGQVASYLQGLGIACENGGGWRDVVNNYPY